MQQMIQCFLDKTVTSFRYANQMFATWEQNLNTIHENVPTKNYSVRKGKNKHHR